MPNRPQPHQAPVRAFDIESLRRIAGAQRRINLSIAAYLALLIVGALTGAASSWSCLFGLAVLAALLTSVISGGQLAAALHGPGAAVACVILMFVPGAGLITLAVLSATAAKRLREAGVRVGLLGADPEDIHTRDAADTAYEGPQLAGKACAHCRQRILTQNDGALCKTCREPLHRDCRKDHRRDAHTERRGTAYR